MQDKIITTFCILDDLLQALHHRDDPQAKAPDSEILTIAILACQEFGGNMCKALQWVQALHLFSFVPSERRWTFLKGVCCWWIGGTRTIMRRTPCRRQRGWSYVRCVVATPSGSGASARC